jgi:tRNA (guanine-N7-)-methyltransferase
MHLHFHNINSVGQPKYDFLRIQAVHQQKLVPIFELMSKSKMEKFAALDTFPNVLQNRSFTKPVLENHLNEKVDLKGKWKEKLFGNSNPITLELACGKGEYSNAMGSRFPGRNFIGVDLKGNRLHNGAEAALLNGLSNVAFLRTDIYLLPFFFDKGEVNEIWIIFPDPKLRPSKAQQRLTSERFINIYRTIMPEGGIVHLKTDSPELYAFTLESVENADVTLVYAHDDIYSKELVEPLLEVKTFYEAMHLEAGKTIKYIKFRI